MGKKKLIVVWSGRFRDFDWQRLELDNLQDFCDVIVLDLCDFLNPKHSEKYAGGSKNDGVYRIQRVGRYISFIWNFKSEINDDVVIISDLRSPRLKVQFCGSLLKFINGKIVWRLTGGAAVGTSSQISLFLLKRAPTVYLFLQSLLKIRFILSRPDLVMIGSSSSEEISEMLLPKKIVRIKASSDDYSMSLSHHEAPGSLSDEPKKVVFIDQGFPAFSTDLDRFSEHRKVNASDFYNLLNRFFSFVESSLTCGLEILSHPKHYGFDFSSQFKTRSVIHGKTIERIRVSELVIAMTSTAISYAILFDKPLILITSDKINQFRFLAIGLKRISHETGAKIFNIDREYTEKDLRDALVIDHAKRESYKRKYLTSRTDEKPNYQVLLDEVINVVD